ncbi:MAG TPA: NrfD/PsrC family molybdoenzyme membrane anchor subunit [Symbiobacteriaceae bacterium]|nr:NrfD/PsrC family molybdoenzyme membrane anchor subunit [Symbiobacteriaceae bacterium]
MTALTQPRYVIKVIWYLLLAGMLVLSSSAILIRLTRGLIVTNLSSIMPWGAWAAFYIYFIGLSAGAFLLSSLVYAFGMTRFEKVGRMALLTALVTMFVALVFIALDLGRIERALVTLVRFNWLSLLAWEIRFYVLYIILLMAELWLSVRADLVRVRDRSAWARFLLFGSKNPDHAGDRAWLRVLGLIGIPLAIFGVHGGTGAVFAVVKARAMWSGAMMPVLFVVSALVSGTALLICVYVAREVARRRPVDLSMVQSLGKLLVGFLLVDAGLLFYEYLVPGLAMDPHETDVLRVMADGRFNWSFWFVQLGMGLFAPAVILLSSTLRRSWQWVTTASVLVVVGVAATRFNIIVPPLITPPLAGLPAGDYHPTMAEWVASGGIIALGLMLFSLVAEVLPLDTQGGAVHDQQA